MAALSIQPILVTGLAASYAAATGGGDTMAHSSSARRVLHVKNAGVGSINVTITKQISTVRVPGVASALAVADLVVAVANGAEKFIGPFSDAYGDSSGNVNISYSGVSSVTVAALELPAI